MRAYCAGETLHLLLLVVLLLSLAQLRGYPSKTRTP
jgi:hypothetical protein